MNRREWGGKRWIWASALLLIGLVGTGAPSARADGLPQEDGIKAAPLRQVKVGVTVTVLEIDQINDRDEKFDVEFYLNLTWKDPRLAFDAGKLARGKKIVPADQIWTPEPQLSEELDVNVQGGRTAHVLPDGTVLFHQFYRATIPADLNLHQFPFDRHRLIIGIESPSYEVDDVVYVPENVNAADQPPIVPSGWTFDGISSDVATRTYPLINERYSQYRLKIDVVRDAHYYLWSVVLPLIPIVITSWTVFWMAPDEFSTQIGVGITAFLTVVAYKISIDSSLPALSYMTRMDFFLLLCQIFVFMSIVMMLVIHVSHNLGRRDISEWAEQLKRRCRWIPPLMMTVASVLLLFFTPRVMTTIVLGGLAVIVLIARPAPSRVKRWIVAIVHPETFQDGGGRASEYRELPMPESPERQHEG